ncbi:MAG: hypothetical protein RL547_330, partial [Actinomycetota bacterium]
ARWSPAARPGSSLPVDGVCPCRTNRTRVDVGGADRGDFRALMADANLVGPCRTRLVRPEFWPSSTTRSSTADDVLDSSRGEKRRRARNGPRIATTSTGGEVCRDSAIRGLGFSFSVWRRRLTGPTAPVASSPVTAVATGCTAPCIVSDSPINRRPRIVATV